MGVGEGLPWAWLGMRERGPFPISRCLLGSSVREQGLDLGRYTLSKLYMMDTLNAMDERTLREELDRCCSSSVWVQSMVSSRPFESVQHLLALADEKWWGAGEIEWRRAFLAHPRIGDVNALKAKFAKNPDAWEGGEQSGADDASEQILVDLKNGNDKYEARFGHIFLVCATGKSAGEMLDILGAYAQLTKGGDRRRENRAR